MGSDSDIPVSLPNPPPPRPAARRETIDAALRKFDGIEAAPPARQARREPRRRLAWATLHRRPAGALAAVAVVAILGIPAIQIAIRDTPPPTAEQAAPADRVAPSQDLADRSPLPPEAVPTQPPEAAADEAPPPPVQRSEAPPALAEERMGFAPGREEKAKMAAPAPPRARPPGAPMMAAPPPPAPPPPPPPPPAEPQADAQASGYDSIVVTGSRVSRPNMESASPVTVIDSTDDFLPKLRRALQSNDRRAILGLIALPLRVTFDGESRTYRTRRDIDRDFDRIFTPEVRRSAATLETHALTTRDGGRLRGNGRLWFGCGKRECTAGEAMRVREVNP